MAKKKVTTKKPEHKAKETKRTIDMIILQQCNTKAEAFDKHKAHFLIWKDGTITKGLEVVKAGKHCEDNDSNSIGIVLEGDHYNVAQQNALMNVIYSCINDLGHAVDVKSYDVFHPGKVNPNLNIRSLMTKYHQTYTKK